MGSISPKYLLLTVTFCLWGKQWWFGYWSSYSCHVTRKTKFCLWIITISDSLQRKHWWKKIWVTTYYRTRTVLLFEKHCMLLEEVMQGSVEARVGFGAFLPLGCHGFLQFLYAKCWTVAKQVGFVCFIFCYYYHSHHWDRLVLSSVRNWIWDFRRNEIFVYWLLCLNKWGVVDFDCFHISIISSSWFFFILYLFYFCLFLAEMNICLLFVVVVAVIIIIRKMLTIALGALVKKFKMEILSWEWCIQHIETLKSNFIHMNIVNYFYF